MAIQFMDNFQNYGIEENNITQGTLWAEVGPAVMVADPDPAAGGTFVLRLANGGGSQSAPGTARLSYTSAINEFGIGWRWYRASLPPFLAGGPSVRFKSSSNGRVYQLIMTPSGAVTLQRMTGVGSTSWSGTTVDTTGGQVTTGGVWTHFEFKMNTTTGDYELRAEGVTVMSGTDASTPGTAINFIEFNREADVTAVVDPTYIKDVVSWDTTGTVNNDFLGTGIVITLLPNADVSSGWVPNTGSSDYELLAETANDNTYITAGDPPPDPCVVELESLPPDVVTVKALQTMVRARKVDGGDANLQVSVRSNGSDDLGQDNATNTSFRYFFDISEIDPDTSSAWTPISVNAAQLVIDRTL